MTTGKPGLESVLENLGDMPTLPSVVARLTRIISDPETTAADVNAVLSSDPGLVTKILKLVNSSYYGFSRRIATISNAVVILGYNQVRNLALSAFIYDAFAAKGDAAFDLTGFWKHSIGAAFMSSQLARRLDVKMEEDAFICGLLHDLGKLIMARNARDHLRAVVTLAGKKDTLFFTAEKEILGYDHAQLGGVVMEEWNLPEVLVSVVRCHHDPLSAPDNAVTLACIVNAADIVARSMLMGNPGDASVPELTEAVWNRINMDWNALEGIMKHVAEEYSRSDTFFTM